MFKMSFLSIGNSKSLMQMLIVMVVIILVSLFGLTRISNISMQILRSMPEVKDQIESYATKDYSISDPRDPKFYNIILEEEALLYEPCKDIKKTASVQYSTISLTDHVNATYNIGDVIRATVTLYDGYGKRKYSGGDHLRATIENQNLKASAPCVVTDKRDGTQTVTCEALWSGTSIISVILAYTREAITTNYRMRTQVLATRNIHGLYKSKTFSEEVKCHPNDTQLMKFTNYTKLCDMTYINSGMSFYCGKPKDVHLLCQDLQFVRAQETYPKLQITKCEDSLLNSGQHNLKQILMVTVRNGNDDKQVSVTNKPSIPCSEYNTSQLWLSRKPTGFFYNGTWTRLNCNDFQKDSYKTCLQDKSLYILGDSTSRAWYKQIIKRLRCKPITEEWYKETWHKEAECYNKQINFKAGWYPHAQPFFLGKSWEEVRYTLFSSSRRIDNIPQNERAIVVIHLYMHVLPFHQSVFKQRMEIIRKGVETFLSKNKQSIIMIKAPHTFESTSAEEYRLSDYFGYVYSHILYDVFAGLHDKVVLLNNRDATIAQHEEKSHPPQNIINAMTEQMLSFACDK